MQILCPRTWSWASTTWRWTVEKKRELGSEWVPEKDKVRGLPFRGAKAYNSIIAISFGVWTTIWAAEHNQQTDESRQRDTSLEFSVYVVRWGQGSITMCPLPGAQYPWIWMSSIAHSFLLVSPFCHDCPPGVWTHLFTQTSLLSMLPLPLLADPEQKIGCLINSPRIAQCSFFLGQLYLVGREQWPWNWKRMWRPVRSCIP